MWIYYRGTITINFEPSNLKLGYETLKVSEIDYVNIRIDAEHGLLLELNDYFAFYPPNYQYSPLYKS